MKFRENEEAVSPVIGVILMVAITVILAAVIAAFVFGMTDSIAPQKDVTVTATQSTDGTNAILTVTIQGGKDVSLISAMEFMLNGAVAADFDTGFDNSPFEIGTSGTITLTPSAANHVVIRATFTDGTQKVLLDSNYNVA